MGRLYRRGQVWYGDWEDSAGERRRESLGTRDRQVAKEKLRKRELAAADPAAHGTETIGEALTYLVDIAMATSPAGTIHSYRFRVRHLARLLGADTLIRHLRSDLLDAYVAHRVHEEEASQHSVHKEMVVLRRALKEARKRGTWRGELDLVVPKISPDYQPRERWLSRSEYDALMGALSPRRRLWLAVAVGTGARLGELERLSWAHVDLVRGWVRIPGSKTASSRRSVPISGELRGWLEAVPEEQRSGRLLAPWKNYRRDLRAACIRVGKAERERLIASGVSPAEAARQAAPLEPVSANDLRRTFASWLLEAGVDPLTVARLLGHSTTRMVERVYGQISDARYKAAMEQLGGCASFVPREIPPEALGGTQGTGSDEPSAQSAVPRDGIEPSTRGFSVRGLRVISGGKSR